MCRSDYPLEEILLIIMCVSFNSQAQKHASFGIKAGFNSSNFRATGLEAAVFKTINSFHLGGLVQIPLTQQFYIQPELLYSEQGTQYQTTYDADDVGGIKDKWYLNYMNVPLLLQYRLKHGFGLETGPQVGFLLNAKRKDVYNDYSNYEQEITEQLNDIDFSWVFNSTYQTKFGFGIYVRYNLGLSEINDGIFISSTSLKNKVFQLGLFYVFNTGAIK